MNPPPWSPWQIRAILAGYAAAILGTLGVVMAVGVATIAVETVTGRKFFE